ncbi:M48 family metallopeptidase [Leptolyngbya sp. FACHB-261]|uniref:M48 family metallopeptidase n=1 Tax=Leptolyngbya sp. FACHB-261 TaxID=2692806 RepID=UPI0016887F20|nr:M48 family metallopeptidase [Leptolyngbya sp. FACHB-261]MBD2104353.1 M48 family metalloprotease [Leptolyngbya sp. FACHB-261]
MNNRSFSRLIHHLSFRQRWLLPCLSAIVALTIWATSYAQPANAQRGLVDLIFRGIQVIQLSSLSDRQEVTLGGQINQQLLSSEFRLLNEPNITRYVDRIGQRLVPYSERPNIPYRFQVVRNNQVNAFATMGGYVYVTSGLLAKAANEAELASVLGHEMGHIVGRHAVNQMKQQAIEAGLASAAGLDRNTAVRIGVELALNRPGSRRDEFEADRLGLFSLTRAGYAASAMPAFMQNLVSSRSVPNFLSTHPATPDRIRTLNQLIAQNNLAGSAGLDNAAYQSAVRSRLTSQR